MPGHCACAVMHAASTLSFSPGHQRVCLAAELHDEPFIAALSIIGTNLETQTSLPHLSREESSPPIEPLSCLAGWQLAGCWASSMMDPSAAGICLWDPRGSSRPMAISWLSTRSSLVLRPLGAAAVKCVCGGGGRGGGGQAVLKHSTAVWIKRCSVEAQCDNMYQKVQVDVEH